MGLIRSSFGIVTGFTSASLLRLTPFINWSELKDVSDVAADGPEADSTPIVDILIWSAFFRWDFTWDVWADLLPNVIPHSSHLNPALYDFSADDTETLAMSFEFATEYAFEVFTDDGLKKSPEVVEGTDSNFTLVGIVDDGGNEDAAEPTICALFVGCGGVLAKICGGCCMLLELLGDKKTLLGR